MNWHWLITNNYIPVILFFVSLVGIFITIIKIYLDQERETLEWKREYQRVRELLSALRTEVEELKRRQDGKD